MAIQSKPELLENLRGLVQDMLKARREGGAHAKLARANGYVDGYIRVLLETGVADHRALVALVAEERRKFDGPATSALRIDAELEAAAELDADDSHEHARIVAA
jgi:uncharacterized protein YkwD